MVRRAPSLGVCVTLSPLCAAAQVLAWLLQLASVGIKCWGLKMSSLKGERLVLVHVCVGISLQVLIGVQARVYWKSTLLKLLSSDLELVVWSSCTHLRLPRFAC